MRAPDPPDPRRGWDSIAPDRLRVFAQQDGEMLRSMLDRLWPTRSAPLMGMFVQLGQLDQACRWLLDVEKAHPRYRRIEPWKRYLREISAKKGVPAPAACASGSS